jgi:hypothetical protein
VVIGVKEVVEMSGIIWVAWVIYYTGVSKVLELEG